MGKDLPGLIVRHRAVALNQAAVPSTAGLAGGSAVVNLFPDLEVPVKSWTPVVQGEGAPVWRGVTDDPDVNHLALSNVGGRIVMDIHRGAAVYRVEPARDEPFAGKHVVLELDTKVLPPEAQPLIPPAQTQAPLALPPAVPAECDAPSQLPGNPAPKPVTIRVLVAYTKATALASSGIAQDVALLIEQLNNVWNRSPYFGIRAELAGSYESSYVATNDFALDLNRITNAGDGYADEIHITRDQTKADMVALLVEGLQNCGIAWAPEVPLAPTSGNYAFAVVNRGCGLSQFTFSHELGHNFGMWHDRVTEGMLTGGGYKFGHIDMSSRLISVMAYFKVCKDAGVTCTRYPSYSSPKIMVKGQPFGVVASSAAAEYNNEVLCRSAPTVSQYR